MDVISSKNSRLEQNIVQIIYCSHASQKDHQSTYNQIVEDIVKYGVNHNSLREITGTLLTDRRFFAQIIEGPAPEINQLYKNILHDERHHNVLLLQHVVTNIRLFPQWPMALVEVYDMSYIGRLSVQSTHGNLREACLSILKSLRPVLCDG